MLIVFQYILLDKCICNPRNRCPVSASDRPPPPPSASRARAGEISVLICIQTCKPYALNRANNSARRDGIPYLGSDDRRIHSDECVRRLRLVFRGGRYWTQKELAGTHSNVHGNPLKWYTDVSSLSDSCSVRVYSRWQGHTLTHIRTMVEVGR